MTDPVVPPTMTSPPPAPDRADRNTFSQRATALAEFNKDVGVPEMQEAIDSAQTNAISAKESADASLVNKDAAYQAFLDAQANAAQSAASAGAAPWISGHTYAVGEVVWSPASYTCYRRRTAGAGTTDPSLDTTNWAALSARPALTRLALINQGVI